MKPVRIDFIAQRRWRWVWGVAALACLALIGASAWQWQQIDQARRAKQAEIQTLLDAQKRMQRLQAPEPQSAAPKPGAQQAARLLQQDLNKVFATVENLQLPGARLRALSIDAASNTLRLEYELDSLVKASSLTQELNRGYDSAPWRFEGATSIGVREATGLGAGNLAQTQAYRGVWLAQLGRL